MPDKTEEIKSDADVKLGVQTNTDDAKPNDPANVEFVGDSPALADKKVKIAGPRRGKTVDSVEASTIEAGEKVMHAPAVNVTATDKSSSSGSPNAMPEVFNTLAPGLPDVPAEEGSVFVINEAGDTMPGRQIAEPMTLPKPVVAEPESIDKL